MKIDELKELFLAEALEGYEELNRLITALEKDPANLRHIDAIFRITHTLKANAAGMGYDDIASLSHILEDVFGEARSGKLSIDPALFEDLYKGIDFLGSLLNKIKDNDTTTVIKYKGLRTKLEALIRKIRHGADALPEDKTSGIKKNKIAETPAQEITTVASTSEQPVETTAEAQVQESSESNYEADSEVLNTMKSEKIAFSDLVQIPLRKLDNLMNLVGELLIERDRVVTTQLSGTANKNEFTRLQRITSELQYCVMDVRLVQINVLFNKFHRIVRDTASIEDKKVDLVLEGTEIEIDRNVIQIISDSLVHLVRNAISHGIELTEQRVVTGKKSSGTITLRARSEKDLVIIEVIDDGKGIDAEIIRRKAVEKGVVSVEYAQTLTKDECIQLIFEPGFSSAETVTAVSGRGVGMDVVKRAIDSIGGKISIETEVGKGSVFSLHLPSSMALKAALLFTIGEDEFAIPLAYTKSVVQLEKKDVNRVGRGLVTSYLNKNIPLLFLNEFFEGENRIHSKDSADKAITPVKKTNAVVENPTEASNLLHNGILASIDKIQDGQKFYTIIVSYNDKEVGVVVDKLLQQKEIVEKPLEKPLDSLRYFSGATILGNGNVCLVLDVPSVTGTLFRSSKNKLTNYATV